VSEAPEESSSRQRILRATAEVLARDGQTKLSLSEVAAQAGVSRPTLYRWFSSKDDLLEEFAAYEQKAFNDGLLKATAGLRGTERLDAALRFIVAYQQAYSGVRIIDIEPTAAIRRFSRVIPLMRAGLERLIPGQSGAEKAATAVRVAVSHYIVRADDADQFLAQLRHAVGLRAQPLGGE
jgi:AcrR family transcriptional regulator